MLTIKFKIFFIEFSLEFFQGNLKLMNIKSLLIKLY